MSNLIEILMTSGSILVALLVMGMILSRLYQRASKQVSFVRTGFGGQKVIMNGGALVFPVLHETIPVNMNTLRLEVRRSNEQALITHDRMRVDVAAVVGPIDSQAFDLEDIAVQQHVGYRVLVIELVVGVRVEQDSDFLR